MVTLKDLRELQSSVSGSLIDEATINYLKDVQYIPEPIMAQLREQLSDPEVDAVTRAMASHNYDSFERLSITARNKISAEIEKYLEEYDEKLDRAILASNDIVKAYNEHIAGHFDKCVKLFSDLSEEIGYDDANAVKFVSKSQLTGGALAIGGDVQTLTSLGISERDAKEYIIGQFYEPSEDPETCRKIVQGRLDYNKQTIALYQNMIRGNAAVLGLTENVAKLFVENLSSDDSETRSEAIKMSRKQIVAEIQNNKRKYDTGKYVDLRPLGLGCLFATRQYTGLENIVNYNSLIQMLMRYDAIVFGHGSDSSDEASPVMKKLNGLAMKLTKSNEQYYTLEQRDKKLRTRLSGKIVELQNKLSRLEKDPNIDPETISKALPKLTAQIDKYSNLIKTLSNMDGDEILEKIGAYQEELMNAQAECLQSYISIMEKTEKEDKYWEIDPIYTTSGGPYTKIDDIVKTLYKEGFRNIYLMSCNPGHHELSKEIKNLPDLTVTMGRNTLMAESAVEFNQINNIAVGTTLSETVETIYRSDDYLRAYCESVGIGYDDDAYLHECYTTMSVATSESLTEGSVGDAWSKVAGLIKKVIGAVVWLFKKIGEMVRKLIAKIAKSFSSKKDKKFTKPIKYAQAIVESAKVVEKEFTSYEDARKFCEQNAKRLADALAKAEKTQLDNLKKFSAEAESKAKSVNETFITLAELRKL